LKQIGLASHQYHDSHGRFPPGYLGVGVPLNLGVSVQDQYVGHLAYLLPHLELANVFEHIEVDLNVESHGLPWWYDASTYGIAQAKLPVMRCPSAQPDPDGVIFFVHYYYNFAAQTVNAEATGSVGEPRDLLLGLANYNGMAGAWGSTGTNWDDYRGIFTDRSTTQMKDILDGTSQTLLFGESLGHRQEVEVPHIWIGSGPLKVGLGIGGTHATDFASEHPGVVQFCYGDGSVRSLEDAVEADVVISIGGMQDGDVVNDPSRR
jgi:hypothetical protein